MSVSAIWLAQLAPRLYTTSLQYFAILNKLGIGNIAGTRPPPTPLSSLLPVPLLAYDQIRFIVSSDGLVVAFALHQAHSSNPCARLHGDLQLVPIEGINFVALRGEVKLP